MWNSTLTRKTPLRSKKPMRPSSFKQFMDEAMKTRSFPRNRKPIARKTAMTAKRPMKRAGKKTKEWDACRARLKPRFLAAGITSCELRFTGCWREVGGFAHSLKRRNITTPELLEEVCAACNVCHDTIEGWPEAMMAEHVRKVIADRPVPV